jgi:cyclohexadieny/prephenate dehydrogenase
VARRVPDQQGRDAGDPGRFTEELFALQRAIRTGDGDHLHAYFTRTRAIRRGIIEAGQDTDAPNFGRGASKRDGTQG